MLRRWGIRMGLSLLGVASGLLLSAAVLEKFSLTASAFVVSTLLFWLVHIIVQVLALKVLVRQPSVALAGLLALAATVVALVIVAAVVSGLHIHGATTYLVATVIIWITSAIADTAARHMVRDSRDERRDERRAA